MTINPSGTVSGEVVDADKNDPFEGYEYTDEYFCFRVEGMSIYREEYFSTESGKTIIRGAGKLINAYSLCVIGTDISTNRFKVSIHRAEPHKGYRISRYHWEIEDEENEYSVREAKPNFAFNRENINRHFEFIRNIQKDVMPSAALHYRQKGALSDPYVRLLDSNEPLWYCSITVPDDIFEKLERDIISGASVEVSIEVRSTAGICIMRKWGSDNVARWGLLEERPEDMIMESEFSRTEPMRGDVIGISWEVKPQFDKNQRENPTLDKEPKIEVSADNNSESMERYAKAASQAIITLSRRINTAFGILAIIIVTFCLCAVITAMRTP